MAVKHTKLATASAHKMLYVPLQYGVGESGKLPKIFFLLKA